MESPLSLALWQAAWMYDLEPYNAQQAAKGRDVKTFPDVLIANTT